MLFYPFFFSICCIVHRVFYLFFLLFCLLCFFFVVVSRFSLMHWSFLQKSRFFFSPFLRGFFLFSLIFSLALGHSSEGHFIQYTYGFFSCVFVRLEGPGNNQSCLLSNCFFFFIRFACLHLPVYVLSINFSELLKTERFTEEDRGFIKWCFFFFFKIAFGVVFGRLTLFC